jgi:hypothetical protein
MSLVMAWWTTPIGSKTFEHMIDMLHTKSFPRCEFARKRTCIRYKQLIPDEQPYAATPTVGIGTVYGSTISNTTTTWTLARWERSENLDSKLLDLCVLPPATRSIDGEDSLRTAGDTAHQYNQPDTPRTTDNPGQDLHTYQPLMGDQLPSHDQLCPVMPPTPAPSRPPQIPGLPSLDTSFNLDLN